MPKKRNLHLKKYLFGPQIKGSFSLRGPTKINNYPKSPKNIHKLAHESQVEKKEKVEKYGEKIPHFSKNELRSFSTKNMTS